VGGHHLFISTKPTAEKLHLTVFTQWHLTIGILCTVHNLRRVHINAYMHHVMQVLASKLQHDITCHVVLN